MRRYSFSMNLTCDEKSRSLSLASFSIDFIRESSRRMVFCVVFEVTSSCNVMHLLTRLYADYIGISRKFQISIDLHSLTW